jgi:hypothetical protein
MKKHWDGILKAWLAIEAIEEAIERNEDTTYSTSQNAETEVNMTRRWDGVWRIISPFVKRVGPDGKVHEGWCAIFLHECCSCRPDGRGRGKRTRKDDGGGTKVKAPKRKRELV